MPGAVQGEAVVKARSLPLLVRARPLSSFAVASSPGGAGLLMPLGMVTACGDTSGPPSYGGQSWLPQTFCCRGSPFRYPHRRTSGLTERRPQILWKDRAASVRSLDCRRDFRLLPTPSARNVLGLRAQSELRSWARSGTERF